MAIWRILTNGESDVGGLSQRHPVIATRRAWGGGVEPPLMNGRAPKREFYQFAGDRRQTSVTTGLKRMCRSQRYDPWFQYAKRYAATKYSRLSSHLRTPGTSYCRSGATTERCLCMCMNFAISQFRNDGVNAVRRHRLENHMCAPTHALGKLTMRPARLDRLLVSPYHQCAK